MNINQFTHNNVGLVTFHSKTSPDQLYLATATKINNDYILTAAHVLYDKNYGGCSLKVNFTFKDEKGEMCTRAVRAQDAFIDPAWKTTQSICKDIAIAKLGKKAINPNLLINWKINFPIYQCQNAKFGILACRIDGIYMHTAEQSDAQEYACNTCDPIMCVLGANIQLMPGDSGGPWVSLEENNKIIGVTSTSVGGISASPRLNNTFDDIAL